MNIYKYLDMSALCLTLKGILSQENLYIKGEVIYSATSVINKR